MRRGAISSAAVVLPAMAVAAILAQPAAASRQSPGPTLDRQTTYAYLQIDYQMERRMLAHRVASQRALDSFVQRVGERCPRVLAHAPESPQLKKVTAEIQVDAGDAWMHPDRMAMRDAARAIDRLHWSDRGRTRSAQLAARLLRAAADFHATDLCADIGAWVDSGYRTLASGTQASLRFSRDLVRWARHSPETVVPYHGSRVRRLIRNTMRIKRRLSGGAETRAATQKVERELGLHSSSHAASSPHG